MESFLEPRNDKVSFKLQLSMRWKQRQLQVMNTFSRKSLMTSEIGTNTFLRKMFSSPWKRLAVCVFEKNSCSAVFFSTLRFLKKFGQGRPRAGVWRVHCPPCSFKCGATERRCLSINSIIGVSWFITIKTDLKQIYLKALVFLYAFEESVDCHLLSYFCDDSNLHISLFKYVLYTMGVSKESISKFLIGLLQLFLHPLNSEWFSIIYTIILRSKFLLCINAPIITSKGVLLHWTQEKVLYSCFVKRSSVHCKYSKWSTQRSHLVHCNWL